MNNKFIISGGGTGGHIFPALSIANALKKNLPNAEILFVGANGRMEMERVPVAGYPIKGLPVSGFDRKNILKNIKVLINFVRSYYLAKKIVREFHPDVVIGVGGYASAPTLRAAASLNIPTLIQEQNSYAGVTNKILARKARKICVAYEGMDQFFPSEKIVMTGNPIRQELLTVPHGAPVAYEHFGLDPAKKTLLVVGGSLGARTINESILEHIDELAASGIQVIWQTGKYYYEQVRNKAGKYISKSFIVTEFVSRMDYGYAVADLVVSRAGASSVSELSLLAKPVILVPSPNVAEDHQTKNAMALVNRQAAELVKDNEAKELLVKKALELIADTDKLKSLSENIAKMALKNSAESIASEVIKLAR